MVACELCVLWVHTCFPVHWQITLEKKTMEKFEDISSSVSENASN